MGSFIICTHHQIIIRQIKSRRMKWAGHVARMGEERNVYRVLVGKPEGKRSLEDGLKMNLREIVWGEGVWSAFTWLRIGTIVVNTVMNLQVLAPRN
jgi:hypothetical protein